MFIQQTSRNVPPLSIAAWPEPLAFGGVLLVAAWLRLAGLGARAFLSEEAATALSARHLAAGGPVGELLQPLSVALTGIAFFLFGDSDLAARIIPSLAGLGLVAACWWLRPYLGRWGALLAAALLGLSPLAVYLSRSLSDDMPAALAFLVLLLSLLAYLARPRRGSLVVMASCVALLASAGAAGIVYLLIFGGYLALRHAAEGAGGELARAAAALRAQQPSTLEAAGVLGLGLTFLSTGYLVDPHAIGWPSLSRFIQQFDLHSTVRPALIPLQVLLGYETLPLVLGALALATWGRSLWHRQWPRVSSFEALLLFWVAAGALFVVAESAKSPGALFVVAWPLTLLGAQYTARALAGAQSIPWRMALIVGALAVLVVLILLAGLPRMLRPTGVYVGTGWQPLAAVLALLVVAFVYYRDKRATGWQAGVLRLPLLAIGLGLLLHTAVALNQREGSTEWLAPQVASRDIRSLAQSIDELARTHPLGDAFTVTVDADLRYPLAWYLRDTPGVTYRSSLSPGPPAVVTYSTETTQRTFLGYQEEKAELAMAAQPPPLDVRAVWRWLLYREPFGPITRSRVALFFS